MLEYAAKNGALRLSLKHRSRNGAVKFNKLASPHTVRQQVSKSESLYLLACKLSRTSVVLKCLFCVPLFRTVHDHT